MSISKIAERNINRITLCAFDVAILAAIWKDSGSTKNCAQWIQDLAPGKLMWEKTTQWSVEHLLFDGRRTDFLDWLEVLIAAQAAHTKK